MGVFMVIRTIFAIVLILAEVFIICFTGEHLNYKSKSIVNAAYELTWYDIPSHQSKMLILIIMRSQKQLTISAGKMMDMSFETYTNEKRYFCGDRRMFSDIDPLSTSYAFNMYRHIFWI
ncbi:PREDICTED: odorant receptor 67a-like [Acromyrmex echinatior]|uniref:odorant receptor 67a-like n=1 Tax=Acromyrmex echinatior TaxID=103372 RepID=UPI000580C255|nr:PREDICTED: odorant receptor 67a-like [Acromyrmex echinatior]